jgi:HrpA-like RNA helicase
MREAHLLLYTLGALDKEGAITEVGRKMNAFPVEVKLAKVCWMDGAGQGRATSRLVLLRAVCPLVCLVCVLRLLVCWLVCLS